MSTKRRPINRPRRDDRFTPAALEAFRKMRELEGRCRCKPRNWAGEYWKHKPCRACDEWWEQHAVLYAELRCKLWEFPCVEHPADAASPYPKGSWADKNWQPDLDAQARYRALAEALAKAAESANA
jgi:hypothetical protein